MDPELAGAFSGLSEKFSSLVYPQLEQFGARPLSVKTGVAAYIDNELGRGWFWATQLGETAMLSQLRIQCNRPMELVESPGTPYSVLASMGRGDAELAGKGYSKTQPNSIFPMRHLLDENIMGLHIEPSTYEYQLEAGSLHCSCSLYLLDGSFEKIGLDKERVRLLDSSFASGLNLNAALELRSTIRSITPSGTLSDVGRLQYRAKALEMIYDLVTFLEDKHRDDPESDEKVSDRVSTILLESLADPPSIDDLASRLYLSRAALCSRFKRETGLGIHEYLAVQRLRQAESMLERSNRPVAEIARMVGYQHTSSFTKMFKEKVGVSPRQWRNGQH